MCWQCGRARDAQHRSSCRVPNTRLQQHSGSSQRAGSSSYRITGSRQQAAGSREQAAVATADAQYRSSCRVPNTRL
eukprot:11219933-Lingulodinium_polyedra.AAC.1